MRHRPGQIGPPTLAVPVTASAIGSPAATALISPPTPLQPSAATAAALDNGRCAGALSGALRAACIILPCPLFPARPYRRRRRPIGGSAHAFHCRRVPADARDPGNRLLQLHCQRPHGDAIDIDDIVVAGNHLRADRRQHDRDDIADIAARQRLDHGMQFDAGRPADQRARPSAALDAANSGEPRARTIEPDVTQLAGTSIDPTMAVMPTPNSSSCAESVTMNLATPGMMAPANATGAGCNSRRIAGVIAIGLLTGPSAPVAPALPRRPPTLKRYLMVRPARRGYLPSRAVHRACPGGGGCGRRADGARRSYPPE